eukprot:3355629-Heterocapsa_arctica.AAC.1
MQRSGGPCRLRLRLPTASFPCVPAPPLPPGARPWRGRNRRRMGRPGWSARLLPGGQWLHWSTPWPGRRPATVPAACPTAAQ